MTSQVILEDGTESPLSDHLRDEHRKGTRGLTDAFLASLHRTLHHPRRDPQPEHQHPDDDAEHAADGAEVVAPASASAQSPAVLGPRAAAGVVAMPPLVTCAAA